MRRVLNVGGGSKAIALPSLYAGWEHVLLDIDDGGAPDICLDARLLGTLPGDQFEAAYCSHNLEHYYRHDGLEVLRGMRHVLVPGGFVHIRVPNIAAVMWRCVVDGIGLDDVLYESPAGPITAHDVIYGWGKEIKRTGSDFYAHKTGYTPKLLAGQLQEAGFRHVEIMDRRELFEVEAMAYAEEQPNRMEKQCPST